MARDSLLGSTANIQLITGYLLVVMMGYHWEGKALSQTLKTLYIIYTISIIIYYQFQQVFYIGLTIFITFM